MSFAHICTQYKAMNISTSKRNIIYKQIKTARERMGISQVVLAEMAGVSRASIVNWETAKRIPSIYDLERLADVLKTSLSFLLGEANHVDLPINDEDTTGFVQGKIKRGEPIDLDTIYSALKSVRDGVKHTKIEDRFKVAQILKWALEELESVEKELSDISDKEGES